MSQRFTDTISRRFLILPLHRATSDTGQDGWSREPRERARGGHDQPKRTPWRGVTEAGENGGEQKHTSQSMKNILLVYVVILSVFCFALYLFFGFLLVFCGSAFFIVYFGSEYGMHFVVLFLRILVLLTYVYILVLFEFCVLWFYFRVLWFCFLSCILVLTSTACVSWFCFCDFGFSLRIYLGIIRVSRILILLEGAVVLLFYGVFWFYLRVLWFCFFSCITVLSTCAVVLFSCISVLLECVVVPFSYI